MAEWLAAQGHEMRVVMAPPYYPQWRVTEGYSGARYKREFVTASPSTSSGQAKAQQSSDLVAAAADGSGWIATSAMPPDGTTGETTDETTSHSAKPPKNGGKAAGYSHLTKLQTAQQVIGYRNDGMVVIASEAWRSSGSKRHLTKGILDRSTWIATSAAPPDGTTGKTTSHPTRQPEDGCQVVGYSHSTKPASWQVAGYRNDGMVVYRCPLWVPSRPSGLKRLLHLASFALSSFPIMLRQIFWRPDVVLVIEPPLMSAPAALLVARLSGSRACLHVQDFEVDAAFDLGILQSRLLRSWVLNIEQWLMRRFDRVSTISPRMLEKLFDKGVASGKAMLFPNWVDTVVGSLSVQGSEGCACAPSASS